MMSITPSKFLQLSHCSPGSDSRLVEHTHRCLFLSGTQRPKRTPHVALSSSMQQSAAFRAQMPRLESTSTVIAMLGVTLSLQSAVVFSRRVEDRHLTFCPRSNSSILRNDSEVRPPMCLGTIAVDAGPGSARPLFQLFNYTGHR
jgi:hypothetical protein